MKNGYLYQRGWQESLIKSKVINHKGEPMPWLSYPAIDFLNYYLPKNAVVFEYGAGYSTAFYAKNYGSVFSVENNKEWFDQLTSAQYLLNKPVIFYKNTEQEYVKAIELPGTQFDLIVVDGEWRNTCLLKAIPYLNEKGLLVLDDANRPEYAEAIKLVQSKGYIAIPFVGMSALSYEDHTTTIFFRPIGKD